MSKYFIQNYDNERKKQKVRLAIGFWQEMIRSKAMDEASCIILLTRNLGPVASSQQLELISYILTYHFDSVILAAI